VRLVAPAVVAALMALGFVGQSAASESRPTAAELESELVCPVCEATLDTSDAPIARRMKAFIRARIAAGDSKSEIKAKLVADFGTGVLAVPPRKGFDWVAWVLPLAGLAVGATVLGALAWRWSLARGTVADEPPLDPEVERRLDAELARFEP
jgi:cytochrome c-type biogenesis protein CcmH